MEFNKLEDYCTVNSTGVASYLLELERETNIKTLNPRMLSGQYQGRVLTMLSKMISPRRILEIGTFTGYSSLCLAEGLPKDGMLDTLEINRELSSIILKYISKSPFENMIRVHFGDAKEKIDTLEEKYDLVFIDAAKEEYIDYYEKIIPKLSEGAIILADNVLWSGKVYSEPDDPTARVIHKFNRHVLADQRVESVILPIRDGLSLIRKK